MSNERDELPEGWEWITVREVAQSIQYGYTQTSTTEEIGPHYLRITDIQNDKVNWATVPYCEIDSADESRYLLKPGDIVFARSGATAGKSFLISECPRSVFASYLIRVQTLPSVAPEYLYAFFHSRDYWEQVVTRGNAQPNANAQVLGAVQFPFPPLDEQLRIVAKIERLFAESRTAREALDGVPALIKRFRQAVLAKAFRGELTERDPSDEPAPVLLERIRAERRAKGKKGVEPEPPDIGSLPELPEGWKWANVGDVIDLLQYGTSVKADAGKACIPVLRMGNIQDGQIDYRDLKYIDPAKEDTPKYLLQKGDVLINRTNSPELVGKAALFDDDKPFVFASYLIRLHADSRLILPHYLVTVINSDVGRRHVAKVKHQVAGQANINSQDIRAMPVPLAPLAEQHRIVAKIEAPFAQADAIEAAVSIARQRAEKVDQAILARAFRGEL